MTFYRAMAPSPQSRITATLSATFFLFSKKEKASPQLKISGNPKKKTQITGQAPIIELK